MFSHLLLQRLLLFHDFYPLYFFDFNTQLSRFLFYHCALLAHQHRCLNSHLQVSLDFLDSFTGLFPSSLNLLLHYSHSLSDLNLLPVRPSLFVHQDYDLLFVIVLHWELISSFSLSVELHESESEQFCSLFPDNSLLCNLCSDFGNIFCYCTQVLELFSDSRKPFFDLLGQFF